MVEIKEGRSKTYLGKKPRRLSHRFGIWGEERESGLVRILLKLKKKEKTRVYS